MFAYPGSAYIIKKHLTETKKEASPYWTIEPSAQDPHFIHVILKHAPSRDEIKSIRIDIQLSNNYPLTAPTITVLDRITHPCINQDTGKFDLYSHIDDWSPVMSLQKTLLYICSELYTCDPLVAAVVQRTHCYKMELLQRTQQEPAFV